MKLWGWLVGILALLWSAIWLIGSVATERVVGAWLAQQEQAGWVLEYDALATRGYPLSFRTVLSGLSLADPHSGWAIEAPSFRLDQPAYQPNQVRATWPETHVFSTPFERLSVRAERLDTMLQLRLLDNLALDQSLTQMTALQIDSNLGWSSSMESATLSVSLREEPGHRYDIGFDAQGYVPAGQVLALLDPAGVLPEAIDRFRVEAVAGFDRAWDLTALELSRPQIRRLDLAELRAEWGDLALRVSGTLDVDAEGIPTGDLAVRAQNWRAMVELAANSGALADGFRGTLEAALSVLAGLSGRPEDLDATLSFADGQVYFGPFPLGPAPLILLR